MPERRVVVTGVGALSALGEGAGAFWTALAAGSSGIRPIQAKLPGPLRFPNGGEVAGYNPASHFEEKHLNYLDNFAQFALVAAREAVRDSGLEFSGDFCSRTAVVTGCGGGGQKTLDDGFVELYGKNSPRVNPLSVPRVMSSAGTSHISMEFGITGPGFCVSSACSSSNHAIGQAFWLLRSGVCDAAVTGGVEAVFSYGMLKSWEAMRVVSPDTCRPFSLDRKGLILGEGAGMLVLETLESAEARGARIYAEIAGFGMTSDAHHITQPSPAGAARAIQAALDDAKLAPESIGYINAHGTGTAANDSIETTAIRSVFGPHADRIPVSSTKSMHGHALGAGGALEAVATVLALRNGCIPPTANYTQVDPACDLDVVPNIARQAQAGAALSNSFAFGGLNAVLAFRSLA